MNPLLIAKLEMYAAILAIVGLSIGGSYFWGHHDGYKQKGVEVAAEQGNAAKADLASLRQAVTDAAARQAAFETKLLARDKANNQAKGVIDNEVKKPVYAVECISPVGVRIYDAVSEGRPILSGDDARLKIDGTLSGAIGAAPVERNGERPTARPSDRPRNL